MLGIPLKQAMVNICSDACLSTSQSLSLFFPFLKKNSPLKIHLLPRMEFQVQIIREEMETGRALNNIYKLSGGNFFFPFRCLREISAVYFCRSSFINISCFLGPFLGEKEGFRLAKKIVLLAKIKTKFSLSLLVQTLFLKQ